jgi:3-phytase
MRAASLAVAAALLLGGCAPGRSGRPEAPLAPVGETGPVPHESDDPAIWRHPTDPQQSLILGTDKIEGVGGLYVFGLDGRLRQSVAPLDRPNNVDVEYAVRLAGRLVDIAVVTERKQRRLRLFGIDPAGRLTDLAPDGLPVFVGAAGTDAEPMGVGVFKRPSDGATFVVVSPKSGPRDGYLAQYRLDTGADGAIGLALVRRFGAFSGVGPARDEPGEIEALVVDDAHGSVYYSDERCCLRKYAADPDAPEAGKELAAFGQSGYAGDREGLAILDRGQGRGFLVSVDQTAGQSSLLLYPREGTSADPHRHELAHRVSTASDETDGLDVSADLDLPGRAQGLVVMMHDAGRSFRLYDATAIAPVPR